jgi:hypothetical protein
VAVCAAGDWPFGDLLGVDWQQHALWAGILTGGLLLIAGYFGVEAYLREQDEANKWSQAAVVSFETIASSIERLRHGMDRLIVDDVDLFYEDFVTPRLAAALSQRLRDTPELDTLAPGDHVGRLALLLERDDGVWAQLAVEGLEQLQWHHGQVLARWSPVMLSSGYLARDLMRFATLTVMVGELKPPLLRHMGADASNEYPQPPGAATTRAITMRWDDVITETVLLQEDFMRAAGHRKWRHRGARSRLSPSAAQSLQRRDSEIYGRGEQRA